MKLSKFGLIVLLLSFALLAVPPMDQAEAQFPTKVVSLDDTTKASFHATRLKIGTDPPVTLIVECLESANTSWVDVGVNRDTTAGKLIRVYGAQGPYTIPGFKADSVMVKGSAVGKKFSIKAIKPW